MVKQIDYNVRIVIKNGVPKLGYVTVLSRPNGRKYLEWRRGNRRKLARMLKIDLI